MRSLTVTENQRAALAWARQNESRILALTAVTREAWRCPRERARLSETIHCLADEAKRLREYALDRT